MVQQINSLIFNSVKNNNEEIQEKKWEHNGRSKIEGFNFAQKITNVLNSFKSATSSKIKNINNSLVESNLLKKIKNILNLPKTINNRNEFTSLDFQPKCAKDIKIYITEQVEKLNLMMTGIDEPVFANQAIDATLASV